MQTSTAVVFTLLISVKLFGLNLSYCATPVEYLLTVMKKTVLLVMYSENKLSADRAKRLG